jgi:cobalt-zinc-cadmium efflux system outer membrane protein
MNVPASTDFSTSSSLEFLDGSWDLEALRTTALARRPEVASSQAEFLAAQAQVKATGLKRAPDLAVQARKESFQGEGGDGVAVALILPLLDWGSVGAERRGAEATAQSRKKLAEAVKNAVLLDVEQALQRVNAAATILREYEVGILEKAQELAAMAGKGYEKGATNYLEVLEAQRTLRSTRSAYYSALADHAKALARLEWAVGCPLRDIGGTEVQK